MKLTLAAVSLAASLAGGQAFVPSSFMATGAASKAIEGRQARSRAPVMAAGSEGESRRGFLGQAALQLGSLGLVASLAGMPKPAEAVSLKSANAMLAENGLPPILGLPDGFSPCVEIYGRTSGVKKERTPYLVQFVYPALWIVSRPNIDKNGEEGTISAGNYQKGDSAALYVGEPLEGSLDSQKPAVFGDIVMAAISQKSQNVYQNFKLLKTTKGPSGPNGSQYYLAEFKYELLTGAGFTVDRRGVASITAVGKNVQALVAATTAQRWKSLGPDLQTMVESFRVYDKIAV